MTYLPPEGMGNCMFFLSWYTDEYQHWVLHMQLDMDYEEAGGPLDAPIERKPFPYD